MRFDEITAWFALDENEREELCEYFKNRFENASGPQQENAGHLKAFKSMAAMSKLAGAAEVINKKLCPAHPVSYNNPDGVRLEIFDSFAGEIPVIYADDAADFEALVTNIVHKGIRHGNISKTGACFVSGGTVRFLILSAKPYSNVPAGELGLDESNWQQKSMAVRLSHECTHYFTKQQYGISNNILHDELMADFIGLYDAFGFYKAEWFLRFMGIIPGSGSRLGVYTEGLSPKVKQAAAEVISAAAQSLERWTQTEDFKALSGAGRITKMCMIGIEGILDNDFF